jgi:hypothetical protein
VSQTNTAQYLPVHTASKHVSHQFFPPFSAISAMIYFAEFSESMRKLDNGLQPVTVFERFHFATLDWRMPVLAAIVYAVVVTIWGSFNRVSQEKAKIRASHHQKAAGTFRKNQPQPAPRNPSRFTFFNCVVILHNLILTIFSVYIFACIVPILVRSYQEKSAFAAFCDVGQQVYYSGINYLVWLFYISKFYELLDTVVLLLKGKPSSFLQTFHHSGSIMCMWLMVITRIPGMWIFTTFNSFIHSIMYIYYTLTCFGYQPSWKRFLTMMQIGQFVIGNAVGFLYFVIPNCFREDAVREDILAPLLGGHKRSVYLTFGATFAFVFALIFLFTDFSRKTYGTAKNNSIPPKKAKSSKSAMEEQPNKAKKNKASLSRKASKPAAEKPDNNASLRRSPRKSKKE